MTFPPSGPPASGPHNPHSSGPQDPYASGPLPPPGLYDSTQVGPPAGFSHQPPAQPLVSIGDITCTQTHVITPSGTFPIAGSQWSVTDMSVTSERMSQTGLVLALVGFFLVCFLSLLFLLMKDRTTQGYIQVTVRGGGITHVTNIPAFNQATMVDISSRVNYPRSLAVGY